MDEKRLMRLTSLDEETEERMTLELGKHVTHPELFRESRQKWKLKINPRGTTDVDRYDAFMVCVMNGLQVHFRSMDIDLYMEVYKKPEEICVMMKSMNDRQLYAMLEWITIHQDPATRDVKLI